MDQQDENLEKKAERAANDLQINLLGANLPSTLRFIALFMLAGGISIIGSVLADIVNPNQQNIEFYLLRIVVGILAISTAYGIIKLQRWALWIYGGAIVIGIIVNPLVTVLPLAVLIYLIFEREKFSPSILDIKTEKITSKFITFFKKKTRPTKHHKHSPTNLSPKTLT